MDNAASATATARDANGRFLPGQSGNPGGKRPGTRNRATLIREAFAEGEEMTVARAVIDKAKTGDTVSARFLLGLLCPRPRGRAIVLDLPVDMSAGDTVAAFNATLQAMAAGEITPDEALTVTRMLDGRLEALNAFKLQRELTRFHGDFICGDELFRPEEERFREPGEVAAAEEEATEDEAGEDEAEEVALATAAETQTEPSPAGRGQGEGADATGGFDRAGSRRDPRPNPLPEGEGIGRDPASADEDLHSACIELELEAESAARQAAQRKLAQWSHLIATQPGFTAEAYIAAEVQRSAALMRSSAALPGHNSRSASALNGVGTVLR
jgi:hypothetical protein